MKQLKINLSVLEKIGKINNCVNISIFLTDFDFEYYNIIFCDAGLND